MKKECRKAQTRLESPTRMHDIVDYPKLYEASAIRRPICIRRREE